MQEMQVQPLGWDDPLEKKMATQSNVLAWKTPWTEKPGGLQFTWSQRVGHDNNKKLQWIPVFLCIPKTRELSKQTSCSEPVLLKFKSIWKNHLWSSWNAARTSAGLGWGPSLHFSNPYAKTAGLRSMHRAASTICRFFVVAVQSLSRVQLFRDPKDHRPLGSSVCGILQARILELVAISFSKRSSWPRDWAQVSWIAGGFFTSWATREGNQEPAGKKNTS